MDEILQICYYKDVILPYCDSIDVIPYIYSYTRYDQLKDLSAAERIIAGVRNYSGSYFNNLSYFEDIYGNIADYSDDYIRDVFSLSPTIKHNNTLIHSDITSKFVNFVQGIRLTPNNPKTFSKTIHFLGPCVAAGFGVDDTRTIPSYLQSQFNTRYDNVSQYRVLNHGVWGLANLDASEMFDKLCSLQCEEGDFVVMFGDIFLLYDPFVIDCFTRVINNERSIYVCLYDDFSMPRNEGPLYIDCAHLSHWGMKRVASCIYKRFLDDDAFRCQTGNLSRQDSETQPTMYEPRKKRETLDDYLRFLKKYKRSEASLNGAIVMNCNPFTDGHRYLIETAAETVDFLYVFVVEEDKSEFSFNERMHLVNRGIEDIKNVIALPSGNFIISAITFPEYFTKNMLQDGVVIDVSNDVELFASSIAPILNIKKRFVGEEPFDLVTNQYNQALKNILPKYDIDVIVVERLTMNDIPISASRVRDLLHNKKFAEISKLVPATTFKYLQERTP